MKRRYKPLRSFRPGFNYHKEKQEAVAGGGSKGRGGGERSSIAETKPCQNKIGKIWVSLY